MATGCGAEAGQVIQQTKPVDAYVSVEVRTTSGNIKIRGWDRPEIDISGELGPSMELIEFTANGREAKIQIGCKHGCFQWKRDTTDLTIHIPENGNLTLTDVSADLHINAVKGVQIINVTSGDVKLDSQNELKIKSVSGDITVHQLATNRPVQVETVSGSVGMTAEPIDHLSMESISGNIVLNGKSVKQLLFQTVSGSVKAKLDSVVASDLQADSVSGDIYLRILTAPDTLSLHLKSTSGSTKSCSITDNNRSTQQGRSTSGASLVSVSARTVSGDIEVCSH